MVGNEKVSCVDASSMSINFSLPTPYDLPAAGHCGVNC